MAKMVNSRVASKKVKLFKSAWKAVLLGAVSGVLYWALTSLLVKGNYSIAVAGNIATILVATIGIASMLFLRIEQPIIIALASGISLWNLAEMTNKLNIYELLFWTVGLYLLTYLLYFWITRYYKFWPVIIVTIIMVILSRLIVFL